MARMHLFVGDVKKKEDISNSSMWKDNFNFEDNHWRCYVVMDGEEYYFQTEDEFKTYLVQLLSSYASKEEAPKRKQVEVAYACPGKANASIDLSDEVRYIHHFAEVQQDLKEIGSWAHKDNSYNLFTHYSNQFLTLLLALILLIAEHTLEELYEKEALCSEDCLSHFEVVAGQASTRMADDLLNGCYQLTTL